MEGLQCRNAFFSWKILYKSAGQWYEIIFCACTEAEERQWKSEILDLIDPKVERKRYSNEIDIVDSELHIFDCLASYSNSLPPGSSIRGFCGDATGKQAPQMAPVQCIIKNTHVLVRDANEGGAADSFFPDFSASQDNIDYTPVLAPERAERAKIEFMMMEVWTREKLTYPAMAVGRSSQLLRHSASTMIRKLSRTSLASRSSTRTTSRASFVDVELHGGPKDDPFVEEPRKSEQKERSKRHCQGTLPDVSHTIIQRGRSNAISSQQNVRRGKSRVLEKTPSRGAVEAYATPPEQEMRMGDGAGDKAARGGKSVLGRYSTPSKWWTPRQ